MYAGVSFDENVAGPTQRENEALMRAASGALATLTDKDVWDGAIECCGKVVSVKLSLFYIFSIYFYYKYIRMFHIRFVA